MAGQGEKVKGNDGNLGKMVQDWVGDAQVWQRRFRDPEFMKTSGYVGAAVVAFVCLEIIISALVQLLALTGVVLASVAALYYANPKVGGDVATHMGRIVNTLVEAAGGQPIDYEYWRKMFLVAREKQNKQGLPAADFLNQTKENVHHEQDHEAHRHHRHHFGFGNLMHHTVHDAHHKPGDSTD